LGREATCTAHLGGESSAGRALLETDQLIFRGAFRVAVPFQTMLAIDADASDLTVVWPGGTLRLTLGRQAARWADKIRHPPSRLDKLGVKEGSRVALLGGPSSPLAELAGELAARGARLAAAGGRAAVDLLFLAAESRAALRRLPALRRRIEPDGALWVLRPKGSAAISEGDVRAAGHAAGLVDVKVAAFSATHSAAKLVIPTAARRRTARRPGRSGRPE
jgi:hypothetical protein